MTSTKTKAHVRPAPGTVIAGNSVDQFVQGILLDYWQNPEDERVNTATGEVVYVPKRMEFQLADGAEANFYHGVNWTAPTVVIGGEYTARSYFGLRKGSSTKPDTMGTCNQVEPGILTLEQMQALEYKGAEDIDDAEVAPY